MAEPTCVINPFSYTTPASFPDEVHQENSTMYGIEGSISFGRFMSDNLEWEKWSSFSSNRNRYVVEAEKYSRPGSVAQKKAYFEAHFKKMAAMKAAALLEQANAGENSPERRTEGEGIDSTTHDVRNLSLNVTIEANNHKEDEKVEKGCENEADKGFAVHQNDLYSTGTENESNVNARETVDPIELVESSSQNKTYPVTVKDETCNVLKHENGPGPLPNGGENESSGIVQRDKPPLQKRSIFSQEASESIVKKNPPLSSYMSPTVRGTSRESLLAESIAKRAGLVYPGKENYASPAKKAINVTDPDKRKTPLRMSINREFNRIISPVIKKIGTSSKTSKECSTPLKTPAKTANAAMESPRMTPSRGLRSRLDSFAGDSKASGSRWHIFSSESPSTGKHSISSPIIPNSFCMNGERAARRKQKLEEKFNATATERPPQSSKFKEKAEAELNKFRQSFCFKAMASPDHYGENEALRSPKQKDVSTRGMSPKHGKQPAKTTSKISLPPRRPSLKQSGFKNEPPINYPPTQWSKKSSS